MAEEMPPVNLRTAVTFEPAPNAFPAHDRVDEVGDGLFASFVTVNRR